MDNLQSALKLGLIVALVVLLVGVAFVFGYEAGNGTRDDGHLVDIAPQAEATLTPLAKDTPGVAPSPSPQPEATPTPTLVLTPTGVTPLSDEEALQVLREVWDLIDAEFYGELPSPEERVYGAIRGMLETLDDEYTSFLEPTIADIERTDASGSFEGIGAMVRMNDEGILEIVRPFPDHPAAEAGLLPGDMVLAVDGQSIVGYGVYEAITLIRGPQGTPVVLTVQRGAGSEPFDVTIVRARIEIPIVESQMLEGDIGYVSLFEFSAQAAAQLEEALKELLGQGATALIFDLRDNHGGWLDQAVQVSDLFLDEGIVLIERTSGDQQQEFTSTGKGPAQEIPLVVLVNAGSASASEIVAGALQDRGRAILIGERTFGKGSVQLPHTLSDGSELRVTIARWFTPDDRAIHGEGLTPDIEVLTPFTDLRRLHEALDRLADDLAQGRVTQEQFDELSARYQEELEAVEGLIDADYDPQLERAIEYLLGTGD